MQIIWMVDTFIERSRHVLDHHPSCEKEYPAGHSGRGGGGGGGACWAVGIIIQLESPLPVLASGNVVQASQRPEISSYSYAMQSSDVAQIPSQVSLSCRFAEYVL